MTTAFDYCKDLVRQGDEDRFMAASFAPAEKRRSLIALYAFNVEVAKTRESVSEPMLGEIRLQWWRDVIDEIYGGTPRQHLVVDALKPVIDNRHLSRASFDALIDARALDLKDVPFRTLQDLESYIEGTSVGLMSLAIETLDPTTDPEVKRNLSASAGRAWALAGLMRALPYRAAMGQSIVPVELAVKYDMDVSALLSGQMHPALRKGLDDLLERSDQAYQNCRKTAQEAPSKLWPAFLQIGLIPQYLRQCRRDDFLQKPVPGVLWRRQFRLLTCMLFGRL